MDVVHGALGVTDGAFRPLAALFDRGDGRRHVARVVESVEHTEHIDARLGASRTNSCNTSSA